MIVAPRSSEPRFALSAAGFIATSTFGESPGVRMSREAKWIWKAETPGIVPAGARVSGGTSAGPAACRRRSPRRSARRRPRVPRPSCPRARPDSPSWSVRSILHGPWRVFAGPLNTEGSLPAAFEPARRTRDPQYVVLDGGDVDRLRALVALLLLVRDLRALGEGAVPVRVDAGVM